MTTLILRNGTVLVHNDNDGVDAIKADILVRDGIIAEVAAGIEVDGPHEVLDCTNKLISPGFVDTHHHVWQTQLKGLHAEHTLLEYLPTGNWASSLFEPDDVFLGQLAGMLEALNGGITTILDFSHITYSPNHVFAAIQASMASGVRSVHGYTPNSRVRNVDTATMEMLPALEPWIMETFERLAHAWLGPRTSLGFACDLFYLPTEELQALFAQVHAAPNVRVITHHDNSWSMFNKKPSAYQTLKDKGLLDPKGETHTVMVHASQLHRHPVADLERDKVFVSISPVSELSMGMGQPVPVALDRAHDGLAPRVSVGIDCHSIGEGFMPGQLRSQLLAVRAHTHAAADARDRWYASMAPTASHFAGVTDAFNLATLGGARALGMAHQVGRIRPGFRADLVAWDARSPAMLAAAQQNPVAAIVLHSQPGDVHGVLVDGVVRKWHGRLRDCEVEDPARRGGVLAAYSPPVRGRLSWDQLADRLLASRARIVPRVAKIDVAQAARVMVEAWGLNKDGLVDPIQ